MTNGFDLRDGTRRFTCLRPSSEEASGFIPNVFAGYGYWSDHLGPTISPGLNDMSLEVWARRRIGNSPGGDAAFWTGLVLDDSGVGRIVLTVNWFASSNTVSTTFNADGVGPGDFVTAASPPIGKWSHYVTNVDRSGNMEFFIDTASQGTDDVTGQAADSATGAFYGLMDDYSGQHHNEPFPYAWNTVIIFPVLVGPVAFHSRILTTDEIRESYYNRKVQNLGTTSHVVYNWRNWLGVDGWDLDYDHLTMGHRAGSPVPLAAPEGEAGTVFQLDLSGNENHWSLDTVADYTTYTARNNADDGKAPLAFGTDPFFR